MEILSYLKTNILCLDGGMGTLLQGQGLLPGELPERWNITHPDVIRKIHQDYFDAGSNVVNANTFGANSLKFSHNELREIIKSAIENAKKAGEMSSSEKPKWVALDIGPLGRMLKPYGDFDFEEAVEVFATTVRLGTEYGADLIFIETMNDSYETKAALLAAKENSTLPVFVSNAYGDDGKLMTGAEPRAMIAMLEGMGADAIGINCSLGPKALAPIAREYIKYASVPVILEPNAGLPKVREGRTIFDVDAIEFAKDVSELVAEGVGVVGGCCGTTPVYIKELCDLTRDMKPREITPKNHTVVSSYTHAVEFGEIPVLIGERINPTGKKRFKEALREGDMDYILREGISQEECGVDVLDVNVGLPEIDEEKMLVSAVTELQAIINLPLQIDTSDIKSMESALRRYNGKAMINSVNGKRESMEAVFPLVKKYGGVVVALTLDEGGIPDTAEERVEIAKNILSVAKDFGIDKKDIIFDPLALTVSADNRAGSETLRAVEILTQMGLKTSLGVSNVSFGLPKREAITSVFFTMALTKGLKGAIINPKSADLMKAYRSWLALMGYDDNCNGYIEYITSLPEVEAVSTATAKTSVATGESELQRAIVKGLCDSAGEITRELVKNGDPLEIVKNEIIPALDIVGEGFEKKTVYLPQLLMSAEAAKSAFEVIKTATVSDNAGGKGKVVIATVKGDIHDIGKNILKLLLENYGFDTIDLGRDVEPERIVEKVIETGANLVGLSALMTTTVPAMEDTIKLLREKAPHVKVMVGGAVLTQEYSDSIGADFYAKDAMAGVRYCEGETHFPL